MHADVPVLIAAAGIGSRLGMNLPKALVEVNGRSILERLLTDVLADERDVRLIVGYRADEVIACARRVRDDVIIVRNPSFRDTSVRHSFWLAARHIRQPSFVIDGDTLIDPRAWQAFRRRAASMDTLIGITPSQTTDAVFTRLSDDGSHVTSFTRTEPQSHEWCGVAKLPPRLFDPRHDYVFQCIDAALPAPAHVLDVAEVDTQADLALAEAFARRIDAGAPMPRLAALAPRPAPMPLAA
jgi:choline kinase